MSRIFEKFGTWIAAKTKERNRVSIFILITILSTCFFSCKSSSSSNESDQPEKAVTPVTVIHISHGTLENHIFFNAVSVFRKKSIIKSTVNGYVENEPVNPGQAVKKGQLLFVMKTKEANALGKVMIDSSVQFNGSVSIKASQNGYVTQLNHQEGDYVLDGEQLCVIADQHSFAFVLGVPFELSPDIRTGRSCEIMLPDGQHIIGTITSRLPVVDPATQTEQYIVKVSPSLHLPENLIAKINITTTVIPHAVQLPTTALLTNVDETQWWVMKMINDSTAVKVPVQTGIQVDSMVQIISPEFSPSDRILISGNYGLPDTALVSIQN